MRRLCRERGVELTEIDLRWGITGDEARQGRVIKICLDEIDRSRPYFLGILGARYGWTPPPEEADQNPALREAYPWILDALVAGLSVTEIEIVHGVLQNPAMAEHAFFYVRDTPTAASGDDLQADADVRRLAALKERIRASGVPVREPVSEVEELGRLVDADLLRVIDQRYPAHLGPTPLEQERRSHDAFAASRRRVYVRDENTMQCLDNHALGEGPPLVVVGEAGAGESSLLAHWSAHFCAAHPGVFLVAHYVSADSAGTEQVSLMRRIVTEIRDHYQFIDELPRSAAEVEDQFPSWLGARPGRATGAGGRRDRSTRRHRPAAGVAANPSRPAYALSYPR